MLPRAVTARVCLNVAPCAAAVIALMAYARYRGVNLSALGIGVDFLQVPCPLGVSEAPPRHTAMHPPV